GFKMESTQMQRQLERSYQKKKTDALAALEAHYQKETKLKAQLIEGELSVIKDSVASDLEQLDEEMQKERETVQAQMAKKESEFSAAQSAIKDLQKELLAEKEKSAEARNAAQRAQRDAEQSG